MAMQRIALGFLVVMLIVTCITSCALEPQTKPRRLPDHGQVFLYLSCPRRSAVEISFAVSAISFLSENGEWIDVALERHIHSARASGRQIKLFESYLPAGKYVRMKWTFSEATLKKGSKTVVLTLPEPGGEHFLGIEFMVFRQESLALFVDLNPNESIVDEDRFRPEMAIRKQGIEITNILLYVTNPGSDCVTVIDKQLDRVVATIAVGESPMGIVTSRDGSRVYVANSGSNNISVIDTAANRVMTTIDNFGYGPAELALSGDGQWLYATNPDADNVSVIDTVSNTVVRRIPVGRRPAGIAVDQERRKIYVANSGSNSVSIIDMERGAEEEAVTVGLYPTGLAIHDKKLYVANSGSNNVSVLEIPAYSVTMIIPVGQRPLWIHSGLSGRIYVSIASNNEVAFIYASTDIVPRNILVGDAPSQMAVDTLRKKLYVVNSLSDDLSVIDLTTRKVKTVIQVGKKPHGITLVEE